MSLFGVVIAILSLIISNRLNKKYQLDRYFLSIPLIVTLILLSASFIHFYIFGSYIITLELASRLGASIFLFSIGVQK